ncbi:hypothetical protein QTG54_011715 [Skeletonema marinoi]|uniref:Uncharacterized protein n=1 Tax=Skeletonema marinoi TaxID=267567 RepID=A0AAD9D968_9STRA|nr:hypothetical protein QTG54_011715 [Skeletonema marinoi]
MLLHHHHQRRKVILSLFVIGFFLGVTFFSHQLENNLDHQLLDTRNNALRSSSSPWSSTHSTIDDADAFKIKKVSYVTSFWAQTPGTKIHPHRREIEAALLANIYNPHIDQVVVFLDGVTADSTTNELKSSCVHFYQDMAEINRQFLQSQMDSSTNTHGVEPMSKVTCVNVITGQPTYHQMFLNALSNVVTGDIVIMANADMAFDDSISKARSLKEDVLLVLGTRGFSPDAIPIWTRQFYDIIARAENQQLKELDVDQCSTNHWSWDTWIFHKEAIQGQLQEEHFQRPNIYDEMVPFYMNENGAENAALWAVEQCPSLATTYNACDEMHSWSFHLTAKTHHSQGQTIWSRGNGGVGRNPNSVFVPKPWALGWI